MLRVDKIYWDHWATPDTYVKCQNNSYTYYYHRVRVDKAISHVYIDLESQSYRLFIHPTQFNKELKARHTWRKNSTGIAV